MLDNKLIKNALAICGKPMTLMEEAIHKPNTTGKYKFSIEKFCYYLLSETFIEKYAWYHIDKPASEFHSKKYEYEVCIEIGASITTYQSGNEQPLIELLSKIGN